MFTGWIYGHLLPHAQELKVGHPMMMKAIAASKKKNDRVDTREVADLLRCDLLPECYAELAAGTAADEREPGNRSEGAGTRGAALQRMGVP